MKIILYDAPIIATLIVVLVSTGLTFQTEVVWVGQDFAGIPSLFFLLATIFVGAKLAGRLKTPQGSKNINPLDIHKKFGIFVAFLFVITFIIGLWGRVFHGELFFWEDPELSIEVIHGWYGLIITVLALLQVVPSLIARDRQKIRKLHSIIGYTIFIVLLIQILSGVLAVFGALAGE